MAVRQGRGTGRQWDGGNWVAVGWEAWGGNGRGTWGGCGMGELGGSGIGRARRGCGRKGVTVSLGQDMAMGWPGSQGGAENRALRPWGSSFVGRAGGWRGHGAERTLSPSAFVGLRPRVPTRPHVPTPAGGHAPKTCRQSEGRRAVTSAVTRQTPVRRVPFGTCPLAGQCPLPPGQRGQGVTSGAPLPLDTATHPAGQNLALHLKN